MAKTRIKSIDGIVYEIHGTKSSKSTGSKPLDDVLVPVSDILDDYTTFIANGRITGITEKQLCKKLRQGLTIHLQANIRSAAGVGKLTQKKWASLAMLIISEEPEVYQGIENFPALDAKVHELYKTECEEVIESEDSEEVEVE